MSNIKKLILLLFFSSSAMAQLNQKHFSVGDIDSYMLSESSYETYTTDLYKNDTLNLKTIFIWQENVVYRVVCTLVKELNRNNKKITQSRTIDLKLFLNSIFLLEDNISINENYGYNFVNRYNKEVGTKALTIVQGSETTIIKKIKDNSVIPILFTSSNSNTCYELKPIYINVYTTSSNKKKSLFDYDLKRSLFLYGMLNQTNSTYNSISKDDELRTILSKSTLKTILSCKLKKSAIKSAIDSLSIYNLTPQKFHNIDSSGVILDNNCTSYGNLPFEENICKLPLICKHQYEYDCYCYNTSISKSLRIYNHCPIAINSYNHIFLYYVSDHLIFKSESISNCEYCDNRKQWQLSIPNVGYWMENIRNDNQGNFFIPDLSSNRFKINQLNVSDFLIK